MNNILEFKNIGYKDSSKFLVKNFNLSVCAGETVAAFTDSRDEYSIMLKLCAGLLVPNEGEIFFFGKNINIFSALEIRKLRSEKMGFIFSKVALINNMCVADNIALPLRYNTSRTEDEIKNTVRELLAEGGISCYADKFPYELPLGVQKIVSTLRAVSASPAIVFYDEPMFGLDESSSKIFADLVKRINSEKGVATVIFSCQSDRTWSFIGKKIYISRE